MKIALTITAYPPSVGGAQIHTHFLAQRLSRTHKIDVFTLWDQNRTDWLVGTTIHMQNTTIDYWLDGINIHKLGLKLSEKLRMSPWVVLYLPLQSCAIEEISKIYKNVLIKSISGYQLVHNIRIGREPISFATYEVARTLKIPFVFTPLHHPRWTTIFHRSFINLYKKADVLIALTNSEKQTLINLGIDANRIFVTGIGPIISSLKPDNSFRTRYNLLNKPIILFLGQKYAYKGINSILEAAPKVWKHIPEANFVFVGPRTKYSNDLFSTIRDNRVIEIGIVDIEEKSRALDACDVLCVPSTQESFGGVFTEAWMFKKPVIGCQIPAVSEVIDNEINGFTVVQDSDQIAEKIITLIKNPALANEFGAAGYEKAISVYSWDKIVARTEEAYYFGLKHCGETRA